MLLASAAKNVAVQYRGFELLSRTGTPAESEGKRPCTFAALLELPVAFVDFVPPIACLVAVQSAVPVTKVLVFTTTVTVAVPAAPVAPFIPFIPFVPFVPLIPLGPVGPVAPVGTVAAVRLA